MRATLLGLGLVLVTALTIHAADEDDDAALETHHGASINERLDALEREWANDVGAPPAADAPEEERAPAEPDEIAPPADAEEAEAPATPPPTFGEARPSPPADSGSSPPPLGRRPPPRPSVAPPARDRPASPRPDVTEPAE